MDLGRSVFVDMWPGWVGGGVISAVVVTLLLTRNRQLGVSFCYAFSIDRVNDWFEYRAKKASPAAAFPMPTEPLPLPAGGPVASAAIDAESALPKNPADFPMPGEFPMPGAFPTPSSSSGGSTIQDESSWPMVFLGGIFLGGIVSGILSRAFSGAPLALNFDYAGFDALWKIGPVAKTAVLLAGGILVGFGTRMAGGCTSGHAIMGAPGLQKASILAMCVFMGVGVAATFLLHALL
ncbi:MAG: YeeE/YedE family protein [Polyangiaceae bacterium]|nr:YeeE/YedE family protein [Polyangiaceae bacterium]